MVEIVAEIGINANGSIEIAKKMIDVAYSAGCDYVKFQKREIESVYSREELDKPRESPWGTTTREQKYGLEFDYPQYWEIDEYCKQKGIKWFVSFWDVNSARIMHQKGFRFPYIKIPSALLTNVPLLIEIKEIVKKTDCRVILSTGMSSTKDIDNAIIYLGPYIECIMACTSTYPTKPEEINAKNVLTLREQYPHCSKIGFSNHYPGLMAMLLAVAYGADMIETHITLDRTMYGSDQAASIEPQGMFELRKRIDLIEKMKGDGIKKIYESEIPIMEKLRR